MRCSRRPCLRSVVARVGIAAIVPLTSALSVTGARANPATAPRPVAQHAALSNVQATLVYTDTGKPYPNQYTGFGVTITRAGSVAVARTLPCPHCSPGGFAAAKPTKSVRVVRLTPGAEPVILVDLFTGGAHCCFRTDIYSWTGTAYQHASVDWGDPGYALKDIAHNGSLEFATVDDRFAYIFTDFADSAFPVQIFTLQSGRLVDVTSSFPAVVSRDAANLWRGYLEAHARHDPVRGILAAWAADEARLGDLASAFATLERQQELADIARDTAAQSSAAAYIAQLHAFLQQNGYG